jgi:hypothetical protein
MTNYPAMCAKATASFSVLSDTINAIQSVLVTKHHRQDLKELLLTLQQHEREKLNATAALHLERIREQSELGDEKTAQMLKDGVAALNRRVAECIELINEALEEIRYAMADEE